MTRENHIDFIRNRISELRIKKNISEHKMSLELGKSGSYIRSITNGLALPSLKELFNIISYLGISPAEFFAPLQEEDTLYRKLCEQLRELREEDLLLIDSILDWMNRQKSAH